MPPRISLPICLRASKAPASTNGPCLSLRPFSSTTAVQSERKNDIKKPKTRDPYILAQAARKKAANLSRRGELEEKRTEALGDPVRGITTPFVQSFDTGYAPELKDQASASGLKMPKEEDYLNFFTKPKEVNQSLRASEALAVPRPKNTEKEEGNQYIQGARDYTPRRPFSNMVQPGGAAPENPEPKDEAAAKAEAEAAAIATAAKEHATAGTAIQRITALSNGSSKDHLRVNIQRCVNVFGRHNTDKLFPPRAPARATLDGEVKPQPETNKKEAEKRIGPDTGSSEVQIAILTAKIRTLADFLEKRGKGDKANKRNLRLLVHRRQKLLQYLRRRERGGPRWQHCIETLGLTEGTWKGEISL